MFFSFTIIFIIILAFPWAFPMEQSANIGSLSLHPFRGTFQMDMIGMITRKIIA